jgi:tetratricopeptide (TPR) repeat protein
MKHSILVLAFVFAAFQIAPAQTPTPLPEISKDRREQALAKLLEAQRFIWNMNRFRSLAAVSNTARLAKQSLQKAVELDPNLAEAYTAMAELAWSVPPNDLDEAADLANIAVKINRNNYGGHHLLAKIYTLRSDVGGDNFDKASAEKAISEWSEIARLDPRNAEAFAFLSLFYERTDKKNAQIDALKKWLASSNPANQRFYLSIMGSAESLSPDAASLKLGKALVEAGRAAEAIEYLNRAISNDPKNEDAVDLLREALEATDYVRSSTSMEALQQALFADPGNAALIKLLVNIEARLGKTDGAVTILRNSIAKVLPKDKVSASMLQITLGDVYSDAERFDEAVSAYQSALTSRGIESPLLTDSERAVAQVVFEKIIQAYKNADRPNDAINVTERARALFGKDDLFADRKLIGIYREFGKRQEALQTARALRSRFPADYNLLRLEASILTETGKVDDAVALVKALIDKKTSEAASPLYDDFSNYIFISMLYAGAGRGKDAAKAANLAYSAAKTDEQKQLARLSLASALQLSGDHKAAEETLRELLKQTPRNPIALNNLGYFFLERDTNFDEAFELIKQAVKIDPTNPSYLDSLGWVYFKLGKFSDAEKYLKAAARSASYSMTIQEHLGDLYQKQNKSELAKSAWRKALVLSSDNDSTARLKNKLSK